MISIVVLEYHSLCDIEKCICSIQMMEHNNDYEIIVSSNSCYSLEERKSILKRFHSVVWVFNDKNGGFGYGMNQGLKVANGDYLVILNPDVILKGPISDMVEFLHNHNDIGAIAPQIVGHNGDIQDSCREFVTPMRFFVRQLRRFISKTDSIRSVRFDYSRVQTVDCLIGAFIMIKRNVYEIVGGLDENYFMYAEDIDWCTRIWKSGYKVVYYPKVIIEYEGSRNARKKLKYSKIFIQSHIKYWKKFGLIFGYPKTEKKYY